MYFIVKCNEPCDEDEIPWIEVHHFVRLGGQSWWTGQPITQKIVTPIEFELDRRPGYDGPPAELMDSGVPLMSRRLANALENFGVNNIEFYSAVLRDRSLEQSFDYVAFNVIGLISASNMDESIWSCHKQERAVVNVSFQSLSIDPKKTHGIPFFRLAENVQGLLARQDLVEFIKDSGIDTLEFKEPKRWFRF